MEAGLLIIFWYGVLHAFGPDHLSAIADFSIGTSRRKTFKIVLLFSFGHGMSLLVFAKLLQTYHIADHILGYGDLISAAVITLMGVYLLYMVFDDRIQLRKHQHEGKEHIHIWFGKSHDHRSEKRVLSAFTLAALMGIGGVRGMLVTLSVLQNDNVDLRIILMFVLGVSLVFISFGFLMMYINTGLLDTKKKLKNAFAAAGLISIAIGLNMLF